MTGEDLPDELTDGGTKLVSPAEDVTQPADEEVEPVEVLVTLAEESEIDPWDIDVIEVTDKFLDRLDESDLRTSGRALFYASVLLRMKSDALLDDDPADQHPPEQPQEPLGMEDPDGFGDPFDALEDEMDRRLERKRARGTPETLDELVRELREAERQSRWKKSREYDTSDSPHGFRRGTQELDYRADDDHRVAAEPTVEDVTGTTHAENVDELIGAVERAINEHFEAGREEILFAEVQTSAGSRVESFLGLLFLANQNRILLQQDDVFGDLWIQSP